MSLVPKFLQLPFQFLEVYLIILKLLSNLWKLMLTNIFRLILLFEFLTLECIAYECRTASKCLKGFGLLNQPTKQEPKFQLIGSQLQQCKKSTELTSNILKNGIIFVSVFPMPNTQRSAAFICPLQSGFFFSIRSMQAVYECNNYIRHNVNFAF